MSTHENRLVTRRADAKSLVPGYLIVLQSETQRSPDGDQLVSDSTCSVFPTQAFTLQMFVLDLHTGSKGGPNGRRSRAATLEVPTTGERLRCDGPLRRSRRKADHRRGPEGPEQPPASAPDVDAREDRSGLRPGLEGDKICFGVLRPLPY